MDFNNKLSNNITHHQTDDGSSTVYSSHYGAHYHSTHGAIQESLHVFLDYGLKAIQKDSIKILEFGFGTGLNTFLTALHALKSPNRLDYHSLELHPLSDQIINELNYPKDESEQDIFRKLHTAQWNEWIEINSNFSLKKEQVDFQQFESEITYDIIYYDAFAPTCQEELWSEQMMQRCYDHLSTLGILVTYCAKGSFKRALKAVGFEIESLPGPPGKREMTRATKR